MMDSSTSSLATTATGVKMTDSSNNILIRRGSTSPWTAPESSSYNDEKHLQEVIAASPHWVPGVPEGAFTVREFYSSAGPVDVMVVAPDGSLTAIECKLESNTEKRRTVIGQLIDYASAVRQAGADRFLEHWHARGGADLNSALGTDAIQELRSRIESGTIGLCWVADRIDDDLRRLIEYLNEISDDRIAVTALQLAYARHADVELLIPSTYGGEIAAAKASHGGRNAERWTRERFVEAVADLEDPADHEFLTRLLELTDTNASQERLDKYSPLGFVKKGVFFRAFGLYYPPFKLAIDKGRLMIAGCWTAFPGVANAPGFTDLALLLGMERTGSASYVPVQSLSLTPDELWRVAEQTALAVNNQEPR
jgi:hypothetical protein